MLLPPVQASPDREFRRESPFCMQNLQGYSSPTATHQFTYPTAYFGSCTDCTKEQQQDGRVLFAMTSSLTTVTACFHCPVNTVPATLSRLNSLTIHNQRHFERAPTGRQMESQGSNWFLLKGCPRGSLDITNCP